jgi:hypothetical protein
LQSGVTSLRDRPHHYWNNLPAKPMSEGFGDLQTFKAPAAKLPPGNALRVPSTLEVVNVPIQLVRGIKPASEAAVRGSNMGDE